MKQRRRDSLLAAAGLLLLIFLFCWPMLRVDIGDDEGLLAVEAQRLLHGGLPNLDFACPYLGATVFYNALWFVLLGQSIFAMRVGLVLLFAVFIVALYFMCKRLMSGAWIWLTVVFVLSLTIPLYPLLGANWNAMIAGFLAFLAALRAIESAESTGKQSGCRMFLAGVLAALAMLFKQTAGLYAGFAVFILLAMNIIQPFSSLSNDETPPALPSWYFPLGQGLLALGTLIIMTYLFFITAPHESPQVFLIFVFPVLAILVGNARLLWIFRQRDPNSFSQRTSRFTQHMLCLLAGGLAMFAIYLVSYLLKGGLTDFIQNGFLSRPAFFLKLFYQDYLLAIEPVTLIILSLLFLGLALLNRFRIPAVFLLLAAGALTLRNMTGLSYDTLHAQWYTLFSELPLFILVTGLCFYNVLWRYLSQPKPVNPKDWLALALFALGTLMFTNVYPVFAYPYVGCNVAFLVLFLGYMAYRFFNDKPRWQKSILGIFTAYWFVFGILHLYRYDGSPLPGFIRDPFSQFSAYSPKIGLRVRPSYMEEIQPIVRYIQTHSTRPDDMFILSDRAPGFYFWTDHINPTRYNYYFFSLTGDNTDIIADLEKHRVRFLLVEDPNPRLMFGINPNLLSYLRSHYKAVLKAGTWLILENADNSPNDK